MLEPRLCPGIRMANLALIGIIVRDCLPIPCHERSGLRRVAFEAYGLADNAWSSRWLFDSGTKGPAAARFHLGLPSA